MNEIKLEVWVQICILATNLIGVYLIYVNFFLQTKTTELQQEITNRDYRKYLESIRPKFKFKKTGYNQNDDFYYTKLYSKTNHAYRVQMSSNIVGGVSDRLTVMGYNEVAEKEAINISFRTKLSFNGPKRWVGRLLYSDVNGNSYLQEVYIQEDQFFLGVPQFVGKGVDFKAL